jgi:5-formaminoimidazole-4-carboxamide-1-beta-D-ribofuranosyl 5'-monophosphate synthetase
MGIGIIQSLLVEVAEEVYKVLLKVFKHMSCLVCWGWFTIGSKMQSNLILTRFAIASRSAGSINKASLMVEYPFSETQDQIERLAKERSQD